MDGEGYVTFPGNPVTRTGREIRSDEQAPAFIVPGVKFTAMKWAKSLIIDDSLKIESRLAVILEYFISINDKINCQLYDIDATGKLGNGATKRINKEESFSIDVNDLLTIAKEDGQIFELDVFINTNKDYQITIRRGEYLDILGEHALPNDIIGPNIDMDINLYLT